MNFLFELDKVSSLKFNVDVQKPPRSNEWTCSIRFNGKEMDADHNADMCLFLEQWEEMREDMRSYNCTPAALHSWQEQTLAYYAGASVECVEPEELDEDERLARRRAYLEQERRFTKRKEASIPRKKPCNGNVILSVRQMVVWA